MEISDHFGLWAASLAMSPGYHVAWKLHTGFCRNLALGDREAIAWRERATQGLRMEAENYGRWER